MLTRFFRDRKEEKKLDQQIKRFAEHKNYVNNLHLSFQIIQLHQQQLSDLEIAQQLRIEVKRVRQSLRSMSA